MAKQKPKKPKQAIKPATKKGPSSAAPEPFEVRFAACAEEAYERFYDAAEDARERGDLTCQHITTLNMIDEVIDKIIPRDPFNPKFGLRGELSSVFRYWKGRLRVTWIGSSAKRIIYIIFISETLRKAGAANDPYNILTKLVMSGEFDTLFDELGLPRPNPRSVSPFSPVQ
jgi:hypothetical protein